MTSQAPSNLLTAITDPPQAACEVVAFPCAGSGPSQYRNWRSVVPADWRLRSVCLPGRGQRTGEAFARRLTAIADEVAAEVSELVPKDRPLLLVGHSLGATIAFETARRLHSSALAVFTCPPPQRIPEYPDLKIDWNDAIERLNGGQKLPADLLTELVELSRPIFEADMAMLDSYTWDGGRVKCDIWALYGAEDSLAAEPWTQQTTAAAHAVTLPGDHYLPRDEPERVVGELVRRVGAWLANGKGAQPCIP